MAKKSKKSKKNTKNRLYKVLKPYLSDRRIIWSLVGAVGVGVTLAAVFGTEKGQEIIDKVASSTKDILNQNNEIKNHSTKKQTA